MFLLKAQSQMFDIVLNTSPSKVDFSYKENRAGCCSDTENKILPKVNKRYDQTTDVKVSFFSDVSSVDSKQVNVCWEVILDTSFVYPIR